MDVDRIRQRLARKQNVTLFEVFAHIWEESVMVYTISKHLYK